MNYKAGTSKYFHFRKGYKPNHKTGDGRYGHQNPFFRDKRNRYPRNFSQDGRYVSRSRDKRFRNPRTFSQDRRDFQVHRHTVSQNKKARRYPRTLPSYHSLGTPYRVGQAVVREYNTESRDEHYKSLSEGNGEDNFAETGLRVYDEPEEEPLTERLQVVNDIDELLVMYVQISKYVVDAMLKIGDMLQKFLEFHARSQNRLGAIVADIAADIAAKIAKYL